MGLFSRIMEKLRSGPEAGRIQASQGPPASERVAQQQTQDMVMMGAGQQGTGSAPAVQPGQTGEQWRQGEQPMKDVDVEAVLAQMAARKGGGGNWRTSIVDLLKLLDLDSSLEARKELADDLGVNAGPHGSAEQNVALQKAVWRELARNGGRVPPSLRD